MHLADTNLFLEVLLEQEKAEETARFLKDTPPDRLRLSEFSLCSVGIVLLRHRKFDLFLQFVDDVRDTDVLKLEKGDMKKLVGYAKQFNLDFDDAYQYTVAEKHDLTLVSFDKDFDRTSRGRKTPAQVLQS